MIEDYFIEHAANILGDTDKGLPGGKIAKYCVGYALKYNIQIPYGTYPFPKNLPNKRTALRMNLVAFTPEQQYTIIEELCELRELENFEPALSLKITLITRYGHLYSDHIRIETKDISEIKHWLSDYNESLILYESALEKYQNKIYVRNLIDDLRLSLELLLKKVLNNEKSLENQLSLVSNFLSGKGSSKEVRNMFVVLLDYYGKFNNAHVKHTGSDSVSEKDVDFVLGLTSLFMKHIIKSV